jgi:pSer/pThr/pTyr-binding forkhead associated (FHA) protein
VTELDEKLQRLAAAVSGALPPPLPGTKSFIVGYADDCAVRIREDPYASSRHARFSRDEAGRTYVEDLGSTNGTWVNGRRIYGPTLVRPGDVVRIGRTNLPWESADPGA